MTDPFDFQAPSYRFAVMGNPVKHSKSPQIHRAFGAQTGIALQYTAIQVDPGGFNQAADNFRANGGRGLNVTVPYKVEAYRYADQLNPRAQQAGAVNTLIFDRDQTTGDNTDGVGLVIDLTNNHGVEISGRSVLIVGAGGAVRGVLGPLLAELPHRVVIVNRTAEKARALAKDFAQLGELAGCGFSDLGDESYDLVINGTSASLSGDLPPLPEHAVARQTVAYDMVYAANDTVFNAWANAHGARLSADGSGMLVEQAAESFRLWNGVRPHTAAVIAALRAGQFEPR